ncbi:MAG: PadR family transcriptional regulator [Lachnospiraceae bacterium]|nr:PadR family transcriptional regulator [Lachnospiraceae bacterium]
MVFNTGSTLLDAIVLAVVSQDEEGTYGYKITQEVRQVLDVSESTLYPVLRRLQKDGSLEAYDMEYAGRNRRYYRITPQGHARLVICKEEWERYAQKITGIFHRSGQEATQKKHVHRDGINPEEPEKGENDSDDEE